MKKDIVHWVLSNCDNKFSWRGCTRAASTIGQLLLGEIWYLLTWLSQRNTGTAKIHRRFCQWQTSTVSWNFWWICIYGNWATADFHRKIKGKDLSKSFARSKSKGYVLIQLIFCGVYWLQLILLFILMIFCRQISQKL